MKTKIIVLFCLIFLFFFLSFAAIFNNPTLYKKNINHGLNSKLFFSGSNNEAWKKVDSLENAGFTRSALVIVEQVYKKSLEENNSPQIIKSLIYKLKYVNYTEENSNKKIINQIKNTVDSSFFPTRPVLQSILADAYWQYYQHNRYRFMNRTETVNFNNNDFETWDLAHLLKEIVDLYQSSLSNTDSLKNTPISVFNDILIKYEGRTYLRPTLYDFLANRALDFYMNEEASVTEPVYKFELKNPDDFSPAKRFVNINFQTQDSLSLKFYTAKILQDLISFHLSDSLKDPLIDIDLKRLNFMRNNSVNEYKDSLYITALTGMEKKYSDVPFSSLILYNEANYYYEKGDQFDPEKAIQYKLDKKRAYDICNTAIEKYPGTIGAEACASLKSQIVHKSLNFKVEYANLIDQPFRALVQYANVGKIYFRIIPWDKSKIKEANKLRGETLIDYFRKQDPVKEWSIKLPDEKDFQQHSVEVAIPKIEAGYYLILLGTDKDFSFQKNAVTYNYSWVTNLSYIYKAADNKIQFLVLDRESGHPVADVKVSLFRRKFDGGRSQFTEEITDSGITDKNGIFKINQTQFSGEVLLEKNKDRFRSNNIYSYSQNQSNRIVTKTFFFLDRAIYRPGQTIFFKRLMLETDGKKENNLKTNAPTTVVLYDANSQKVSELKLRTNDYGTFDGTFIAPSGVLTGIWL